MAGKWNAANIKAIITALDGVVTKKFDQHRTDWEKNAVHYNTVNIFQENVEKINAWKAGGLKTAVISDVGNTGEILQKAKLGALFDVIIERSQLPAKNNTEILLAAANKLGVHPQQVLALEATEAWVAAARKANFNTVVGIGEAAHKEALQKKGADIVVNHLGELNYKVKEKTAASVLPSAISRLPELVAMFRECPPLFFLDFDGTLSPIVENHDEAYISEEMKGLVAGLAKKFPVAVVSGRGLSDVKERLGLPNLYYAGSHGFEIAGPDGFSKDQEEAVQVIPVIDRITPVLKKELEGIAGVDFERKKFSLAIHYRRVEIARQQEVHEVITKVVKDYPELLLAGGKKVLEIRPAIDWHKGKAVEFLKRELSSEKDPFSVYLGDDLTDEDAFSYVSNGIGILVGDHGQETNADYRLEGIDGVMDFFKALLKE